MPKGLAVLEHVLENPTPKMEAKLLKFIEKPSFAAVAEKVVDHLSPTAKEDLTQFIDTAIDRLSPATGDKLAAFAEKIGIDLPEPFNIVRDNETVFEGLSGTQGQADYFIFDLSSTTFARTDEAVYGFEVGLDKLVFVNAANDEVLGGPLGAIEHRDLSPSLNFAGLPPGDPAVNDSLVWFQVRTDLGFINLPTIVVDEPTVTSNDVLRFTDDPFQV
jgi:hypothetical protein